MLERVAATDGDVLCFGHGHASRALVAVALQLDPHAGARLALDPATISIVGSEHEERALRAGTPGPVDGLLPDDPRLAPAPRQSPRPDDLFTKSCLKPSRSSPNLKP